MFQWGPDPRNLHQYLWLQVDVPGILLGRLSNPAAKNRSVHHPVSLEQKVCRWNPSGFHQISKISARDPWDRVLWLYLPGKVQPDFCSILFHIHTFSPWKNGPCVYGFLLIPHADRCFAQTHTRRDGRKCCYFTKLWDQQVFLHSLSGVAGVLAQSWVRKIICSSAFSLKPQTQIPSRTPIPLKTQKR